MIWSVPQIWKERIVWIIGGGPSLSRQFHIPEDVVNNVKAGTLPISAYSSFMSILHDKPVIGINMAYKIGDWMDIVFFGDKDFYSLPNVKEELSVYPGKVVSCHSSFRNHKSIMFVDKADYFKGIAKEQDKVCWNQNSGAAAISLAANMGAKRIILVGFDMKDDKDQSHWHSLYAKSVTPYHIHLSGFAQIAIDAKERGIEIINANPDSNLLHFPRVTVDEVIRKSYV